MIWADDVESAIEQLGGRAHLSAIYSKVREISENRNDTTGELEAWVRNALQQNSRGKGRNIFRPVYPVYMKKGIWELNV